MAITLKKLPKEIDFAGNDIYYICKGNAYANDVTASSVTILRRVHGLTVGQKIVFSFMDIVVEIRFVSSPDDSGTQILAPNTGTNIIIELKKNYQLNKYYNITGNDLNIVFTSKDKPGSIINVDLSSCQAYSLQSSVAGNDYLVRNKQYKIFSALYLQSGIDTFELKNEMFTDVNNLGESTIVINGILNKMLDDHLPPYSYENRPRITYSAKKYYVQFAEYYNKTVRQLTTTGVRLALPGKIPVLAHKTFDYIAWMQLHQCFLSNVKSSIFTTYRAEQYLYYLCEKDKTNLYVVADIIYVGDSTESKELFTIPSIKKGEIICIPAGIMHSGVHRDGRIVKAYRITLKQRVNIVIGSARDPLRGAIATSNYEVGREPADAIYFLYSNALGVYETLIASKPKTEVSTKRTQIEKFELDGYNQENNLDDSTATYEAVTIPLTKDEQRHFKEFLDSDDIYIKQDRRRYKVSLEATSIETENPKIQIQALKFKYKLDVASEIISEDRNYDDGNSRIDSIDRDVNVIDPTVIGRDTNAVTDHTVNTLGDTTETIALNDHIFKVANMLKLGHVRGGGNVTIDDFGRMWSQATDLGPCINEKLTGLTVAEQFLSILATDSILTAFGKIQKYISSLKALAFKDKVNWNSDIDNLPGSFTPSAHSHGIIFTKTLTVAGWANKQQSISVAGVTDDNKIYVSPSNLRANFLAYGLAQVSVISQSLDTLTFECSTVPTIELTVNIEVL